MIDANAVGPAGAQQKAHHSFFMGSTLPAAALAAIGALERLPGNRRTEVRHLLKGCNRALLFLGARQFQGRGGNFRRVVTFFKQLGRNLPLPAAGRIR